MTTTNEKMVWFLQQFRQSNFGDCPEAVARHAPGAPVGRGSWFDMESAQILAALSSAPTASEAAATVEEEWGCAARHANGANGPQDCDWPMCGCDPYADKVIAALQECGHLVSPTPPSPVGRPQPETGQGDAGALADIAAERRRQIEIEGCTPEKDDAYTRFELASAASCYAVHAQYVDRDKVSPNNALSWWPWDLSWWKPTNRRRDLVKAGALIVAEIERLDRLASPTTATTAEGTSLAPADEAGGRS